MVWPTAHHNLPNLAPSGHTAGLAAWLGGRLDARPLRFATQLAVGKVGRNASSDASEVVASIY